MLIESLLSTPIQRLPYDRRVFMPSIAHDNPFVCGVHAAVNKYLVEYELDRV